MKPHLKMILQLLLEASILRMVLGTECSAPLGMESGAIEDSQLTASSFRSTSWGNSYPPEEARLNNNDGAWYPAQYDTDEWLQVDLLVKKQITGIKTQGHQYVWTFGTGTSDYYVKKFKVLYSDVNNEAHLVTFQESGSDKIFDGNTDGDGVKTNNFEPPINARFIRLMATDWRWRIALRLELLGCDLQTTTTQITTVTTTVMQTTRSTPVATYPLSSTKSTTVTMEGITSAAPQRSTFSASSGPGTASSPSFNIKSSPSFNNTSGNSDGLAGNQTATPSVAIIGGAVAAGVVVIIAIIVSIFLIRRRRSKPKNKNEPSPQADEGTVDNIYYGGVAFAANGNASTNGNVSIGQSEGMVDNNLYAYPGATNGNVTIDQSEGMVDNHLYAGTSTTNGTLPIDQSEGTVDNHLYAGTGDACLETSHYDGNVSAQDSVYYNVAHTSDEGVVENDIYC